jgi:hypothetical protein
MRQRSPGLPSWRTPRRPPGGGLGGQAVSPVAQRACWCGLQAEPGFSDGDLGKYLRPFSGECLMAPVASRRTMDARAATEATTPSMFLRPVESGFVLRFKKSGLRQVHSAYLWKPVEKIPSTRNIATLGRNVWLQSKKILCMVLGGNDGATSTARGNHPRGG